MVNTYLHIKDLQIMFVQLITCRTGVKYVATYNPALPVSKYNLRIFNQIWEIITTHINYYIMSSTEIHRIGGMHAA